jgi:hypothetical protein
MRCIIVQSSIQVVEAACRATCPQKATTPGLVRSLRGRNKCELRDVNSAVAINEGRSTGAVKSCPHKETKSNAHRTDHTPNAQCIVGI